MPQPIPYVLYPGTCAAAVQFLARSLDARIEVLMRNGDSPIAAHCAPEAHDQILHARLQLPDGGTLMAGDCPSHMPYEGVKGVNLTLNYESEAAATRVFEALSEGGTVVMPMQPAFWAKTWGMCVDQFGVSWIVNGVVLPH